MIRKSLPWIVCSLAALGLSVSWFGRTPLFGDEIGYGYATARWISDHSMALVPAGEGRGEQAMGHPALFFWLWAALMRLFGDTLATARILPTMATAMALAGVWRLGRETGGSERVGAMAALGLLASPLFLAQAFRALPDTAHLASVAWAFVFFARGRSTAAASAATLAVVFRLQGILLIPAFLAADCLAGRRVRTGSAVWLTPLLVPVVTGLMNLQANGYFFFPAHLGMHPAPLPAGWVLARTRFFLGHLLGEDFRWFPISVALALMFRKRDGSPGTAFFAVLALPALLHPQTRLAVTGGLSAFYILRTVSRRRPPSPATTAMLLFCGILVAFHVFIVAFSPDPTLNLFRYVIGAYAPLIALTAAGVSRAGKTASWVVWLAFCAVSLSCIDAVRHPWQSEATVAGHLEARAVREAVNTLPAPVYPDPRVTGIPALGYVSFPQAPVQGDRINLILPSLDVHRGEELLPPGYSLTGVTNYRWTRRGLSVVALEAVPDQEH